MEQSLHQYRRLGARGYAEWMCAVNGVKFSDAVPITDNHAINAYVANIINNPEKEEINKLDCFKIQ